MIGQEKAARVQRTGGQNGNISTLSYRADTLSATEIAAIVAARFNLSPCMGRVVCELAGIGGHAA